VDRTLADVKRAVQQRNNELKATGGQLVDIPSDSVPSPTAARLADSLRHELDGVVGEVASLRKQAAGTNPNFGAIRTRAARLLAALRSFVQQEGEMIQETVNRDVGGEG
jgi:phage-related minor tail protein